MLREYLAHKWKRLVRFFDIEADFREAKAIRSQIDQQQKFVAERMDMLKKHQATMLPEALADVNRILQDQRLKQEDVVQMIKTLEERMPKDMSPEMAQRMADELAKEGAPVPQWVAAMTKAQAAKVNDKS